MMKLFRRFGLFTTLRDYQHSWLIQDAVAAVMLIAIAIPGQIATARLAGMPPHAGLYAFLAGTLAFAAFGGNRFASVAADSTIAPIFAGMVATMALVGSDRYGDLLMTLSILVGIVLIVVGLLKAGWIADLLSIPVTVGFFGGISIHIIIGQLPGILGIPDVKGHVFYKVYGIIHALPQVNFVALAIGLFVLAVIFGLGRVSRKIPGALIALVVVSLATWAFDLHGRHDVAVLGALNARLPRYAVPDIAPGDVAMLFPLSLSIALICMMQTSAVVRSFPSSRDQSEDISRSFAAVGIGNVLAGLSGAFPVNASPPSTATVANAGGRSQLCGLFAALMVVMLILFAGSLLAYVPMAALGAVLIVTACRILKFEELFAIARAGGVEFILVMVGMALVVVLRIETGVMLSVILSLIYSVYTVARPVCAELERLPGTTIWWPPDAEDRDAGEQVEGVLAFAPAAPINFTNVEYICKQLLAAIEARKPEEIRLVVIDASGVANLDFTGARVLASCITLLRRRGMKVALARLSSPRAGRQAVATGFLTMLGEEMVFHSVDDAVRAFQGGDARMAT